jgi:medium-chain acyl-[acyl-carrier-protein] hydrolase
VTAAADAASRWVVPRGPRAAKFRLLCFPYAGAGAAAFRGWAGGLPEWVDLCPVQLPGRENRLAEPPASHTEVLVAEMANGLQDLCTGSFGFFGHSMGGLLAYELCRELRRRGRQLPQLLLVSALPAPHLAHLRRRLSHLSDSELVAQMRRYQGTPRAVLENRELLQLMLHVLRADFGMLDVYSHIPEAPLELRIVAYAGRDDHEVPIPEMEAWRVHTAVSFDLRVFDGNHFFLHSREAAVLRDITAQIGGCLS